MSTEVSYVPKVVPADAGASVDSGSEIGRVILFAADTGRQFQFVELSVEPGNGPPYHVHTHEDELFYVLEGEIEFTIDGKKTVTGPGTTVFGPRGVPHYFRGAGNKTAKFLCTITGDNFERFFGRYIQLRDSGGLTPESVTELAAEHGIRFLPEP